MNRARTVFGDDHGQAKGLQSCDESVALGAVGHRNSDRPIGGVTADNAAKVAAAGANALVAGSAVFKGGTREIDSLRRNLQREHLRRLAGALVRPTSPAAADVRGVHRMVAHKLEAELKRAAAAPGWNDTARAHLAESAQTLAEALRAPLMKQGV